MERPTSRTAGPTKAGLPRGAVNIKQMAGEALEGAVLRSQPAVSSFSKALQNSKLQAQLDLIDARNKAAEEAKLAQEQAAPVVDMPSLPEWHSVWDDIPVWSRSWEFEEMMSVSEAEIPDTLSGAGPDSFDFFEALIQVNLVVAGLLIC